MYKNPSGDRDEKNFFSIFELEKVLYGLKKGADHFFPINMGLILTIKGSFWPFYSKNMAFYSKKVEIAGFITRLEFIRLKKVRDQKYTLGQGLSFPPS